jgi:hypothetical protein
MPLGITTATRSDLSTLQSLVNTYGTADYNAWQTQRIPQYSFVKYPSAGAVTNPLFGFSSAQSGYTLQDTNLQKPGCIAQNHFLVRSISCVIKCISTRPDQWGSNANCDLNAFASEFLLGLGSAGVLNFFIGAKPFLQMKSPFILLPNVGGADYWRDGGIYSATITAGAATAFTSDVPYVSAKARRNQFILDPPLFIAAEQPFTASIDFPSGAIPIISTNVYNSVTNPYYIGCVLDGVLIRPVQ